MVFVGEYVKQKQLSDSLRRDGMLPVYVCEDDAVIRAAQKEYLEKQIMIEG